MYKLCFYVPETHLESVKQAVFAAGAGRQGDYDQCCWQTLGRGQFRPLPGSNPYIGYSGEKPGPLEVVAEYKVEMLCADDLVRGAVAALIDAHPYEEPAYDVWLLEAFN